MSQSCYFLWGPGDSRRWRDGICFLLLSFSTDSLPSSALLLGNEPHTHLLAGAPWPVPCVPLHPAALPLAGQGLPRAPAASGDHSCCCVNTELFLAGPVSPQEQKGSGLWLRFGVLSPQCVSLNSSTRRLDSPVRWLWRCRDAPWNWYVGKDASHRHRLRPHP